MGSDYFHVSFLETCKSYGLCPTGLSIRKKPFIVLESDKLKVFWKETVENTEKILLKRYVLVYVKGCSALNNKALIKEKLETYGRKLRLMGHYRNEESEITINPLKKKSRFNPKRKHATIEISKRKFSL